MYRVVLLTDPRTRGTVTVVMSLPGPPTWPSHSCTITCDNTVEQIPKCDEGTEQEGLYILACEGVAQDGHRDVVPLRVLLARPSLDGSQDQILVERDVLQQVAVVAQVIEQNVVAVVVVFVHLQDLICVVDCRVDVVGAVVLEQERHDVLALRRNDAYPCGPD